MGNVAVSKTGAEEWLSSLGFKWRPLEFLRNSDSNYYYRFDADALLAENGGTSCAKTIMAICVSNTLDARGVREISFTCINVTLNNLQSAPITPSLSQMMVKNLFIGNSSPGGYNPAPQTETQSPNYSSANKELRIPFNYAHLIPVTCVMLDSLI